MFDESYPLSNDEIDACQLSGYYDLYNLYPDYFSSGCILLHGSNYIVDVPRADKNDPELTYDFGFGFYTTTIPEQAEKWAQRKAAKSTDPNDDGPVVSVYLFDPEISTYVFNDTDEEWLDFVCECRAGKRLRHNDVELIVGRVADDDVIQTVQNYADGIYDKDTAISELRFAKDNDQYLFTTNDVCQHALQFVGWYYAE